jgi:hypothetical protein
MRQGNKPGIEAILVLMKGFLHQFSRDSVPARRNCQPVLFWLDRLMAESIVAFGVEKNLADMVRKTPPMS